MEGSAGYDVFACEAAIIGPGHHSGISIGIALRTPEGTYAQIAPRSGTALRQGIDVLGGVVDSDYRGIVKVIIQNHGQDDFKVCEGDRIV